MIWSEVTFLHWPAPAADVAPLLPTGVAPDEFDGTSYLGVILLRMRLPGLGSLLQTNVRLYSVDAAGRHGVVFLRLHTSRPDAVLAGRLLGFRYRWSRMGLGADGSRRRYTWDRFAATIRVDEPVAADPLDEFLTGRYGLHAPLLGRTCWVPVAHPPWTLHAAECETTVGLDPPPVLPVRWSPGVEARLGRPQLVA